MIGSSSVLSTGRCIIIREREDVVDGFLALSSGMGCSGGMTGMSLASLTVFTTSFANVTMLVRRCFVLVLFVVVTVAVVVVSCMVAPIAVVGENNNNDSSVKPSVVAVLLLVLPSPPTPRMESTYCCLSGDCIVVLESGIGCIVVMVLLSSWGLLLVART